MMKDRKKTGIFQENSYRRITYIFYFFCRNNTIGLSHLIGYKRLIKVNYCITAYAAYGALLESFPIYYVRACIFFSNTQRLGIVSDRFETKRDNRTSHPSKCS